MMIFAVVILLPLLGALLPALLYRRETLAPWVALAITGVALALVLLQTPAVFRGETLTGGMSWLPDIGLNLTFRFDGLALLFTLLILGIGLLVILYARYYLAEDDPKPRFYSFLLLFMGAMLGIVLSENLLLLVVFWELTSLSSFLLIGYWHHLPEARQGARMALTITGAGGLALLGGVLLLGHIVGSYELTDVLTAGDEIQNHTLYLPTLLLILFGAFTKSAQFPFHFWLPHAMSAPTPVSAYLHSATMVKAGIFLLARLFPALAGTEAWFLLVSSAGLATLVFAAYVAILQHDLKGLLAYSTLSHLGLITLLFGLGTPLGEVAGVFHIINHAVFKASLFMAAGIIDHEAGTRDIRRLNGLFKYMPYTAVLAIIAAAAMAGVPLFNGFLSKEMFFGAAVQHTESGGGYWLLPVLATAAGIFSVAYSVRFVHDVFFNGEPINLPKTPHEPPRWMKIPVEILVALCLLVGIFPAIIVGPLLEVAAASVLGSEPLPEYGLYLWHGLNLPLLMSGVALGGGIVVYLAREQLFALHEQPLRWPSGKHNFEALIDQLTDVSTWITRQLENGSLQRYVFLLLLSAVFLSGWQLIGAEQPPTDDVSRIDLYALDAVTLTGAALLVVATFGTVLFNGQRLIALIMLSVVGLIIVLGFVRFSAPDLALTQLSVEVVTVLLLLLALFFLPHRSLPESSPRRRWRDLTLATVAGLGAMELALGVLTRPHNTISDYFLHNSVPGGGGTNVVNVILVDFRGFDTLGEIAVLAVAALGVVALLGSVDYRRPALDPSGQPWSHDVHPLIMQVVSRAALPLMLLVAIYLFLRGHNEPGGGFIAGLVAALALLLQYLANGIRWSEEQLRIDLTRMVGIGLLCAMLTGFASWLFGHPFLTSTYGYVHWPLGKFEIASALAFDLGVFLTVVGIVLLMLRELGRLSQSQASNEDR